MEHISCAALLSTSAMRGSLYDFQHIFSLMGLFSEFTKIKSQNDLVNLAPVELLSVVCSCIPSYVFFSVFMIHNYVLTEGARREKAAKKEYLVAMLRGLQAGCLRP